MPQIDVKRWISEEYHISDKMFPSGFLSLCPLPAVFVSVKMITMLDLIFTQIFPQHLSGLYTI